MFEPPMVCMDGVTANRSSSPTSLYCLLEASDFGRREHELAAPINSDLDGAALGRPLSGGGSGACMLAPAREAERANAPLHDDVTGDSDYVVLPASMAFEVHGKPITQSGAMFTVALRKRPTGWRIVAWAWAKGRATRAGALV